MFVIYREKRSQPRGKKKYFANRFQKIVFWIIQLKNSSISGRIYHDHDGMIIYLAVLGIKLVTASGLEGL